MACKNIRGTGLIELLITIPLFTLLIAGTLLIYKVIASKNAALRDSYQINLLSLRLNREIRVPLDPELTIDNENIKIERRVGNKNFIDTLTQTPLSWSSEVSVAFTPRNNPLYGSEQLPFERFSEKNLLLIHSWDWNSTFGKKLKKSIDYSLYVILLSLLGK